MTKVISAPGICFAPREARAEMPCCGVLATAVFAGAPFPDVWKRFEALQRRKGAWKGSTYDWQRRKVLNDLGVKFIIHDALGKGVSVQTFAGWMAKPDTMYCLSLASHVVTLYNGVVTDQTASCHWSEHRNKRWTVNSYWERVDV
jgi:hypothetical protein